MDPKDFTSTITVRDRIQPEDAKLALMIVHAPDASVVGRKVALGARGLHIGRSPTGRPRLEMPDPTMSRNHVHLWVTDTGLLACEDQGSKNGTFWNGQRATTCYLEPGSVLRCAGSAFVVLQDAQKAGSTRGVEKTGLAGVSGAMARVRAQLEAVAPTTIPVLLLGDTGTGKDAAAKALHDLSGRPGKLQALNCATVAESLVSSTLFGHVRGAFTGADKPSQGLIRAAHKGTLFLDEVDELAPVAQAALLRVVEDGVVVPVGSTQEHTVDVRVVAATARDIFALEQREAFRSDLLARLDDFRITLPPVADRREDILLLFARFWREARDGAELPTLEADAAEALLIDPWRRNVRGLRRLAIRLATMHPDAHSIAVDILPEELSARVLKRSGERSASFAAVSPPPSPASVEEALRATSGNVSRAAQQLGKDRKQVYRLLKRYGIDPASFRES